MTGRYVDLEAERTSPRTVHSLKTERRVNLFDLARRHVWPRFLVDTEYGWATYIEVRVSTTGLLVREVGLK